MSVLSMSKNATVIVEEFITSVTGPDDGGE
jgi:hypothetical protein